MIGVFGVKDFKSMLDMIFGSVSGESNRVYSIERKKLVIHRFA